MFRVFPAILIGCFFHVFCLLPATVFSAEPFFPFEPGGEPGVTPRFQAWHTEFEDNGSYGESWFYMLRTDEGGVLFALFSITNLGLRTFDGTYEVDYYAPDGQHYNVHKEYTREQVKASTEKMEVSIGTARTWGGGNDYHVRVDDPAVKLAFDIVNILPPYKFGDGALKFREDKSEAWWIAMNTPCGRTSGNLTIGGKSFKLEGFGYHDHAWSNIKVPTFVSQWYTLRVLEADFAVVLHDQALSKTFGSAHNRFGVLGVDGKLVAGTRNFQLEPKAKRKVASGFNIPSEYALLINANGYKVTGTIKEDRFLAAIDVLGQVSWPIRMAIKAFYTNPYFHRYTGKCELDVTDKAGNQRHISGTAVLEANFF